MNYMKQESATFVISLSDGANNTYYKPSPKRKIILRGSRIRRSQRCLAVIITFFICSSNTSLAFSLKDLSIKRHHHLRIPTKTVARSAISKGSIGIQYPFVVVVTNQSSDDRSEVPDNLEENDDNDQQGIEKLKKTLSKRITRLEDIVSRQEVEIYRLKSTCAELSEVSEAFTRLLQLLREAGLDADSPNVTEKFSDKTGQQQPELLKSSNSTGKTSNSKSEGTLVKVIESYDDSIIFGTAPSSVIDAADAAGAAILAAMLGGKQRMLIDVRDAELSSDPEILVQFIELSILPIAAGLEGLESTRNRVKIVFPKVSQLLEYRRTMALAAPEVVALSTLGFDPVEKRDKLVVIVAPHPDDDEGIQAINDLLTPSEEGMQPIQQPVVILNYHMIPFSGVDLDFETAYHLRLLAVQYMADSEAEEFFEQLKEDEKSTLDKDIGTNKGTDVVENDTDDDALENAMKHAHEVGINEGITRAMVIRAYPRPWHIFVDLSPDTDSDFEVAATFDKEPTMDEVNLAIIECLEGSEREDEIVAQQMQQALEDGQLNQVSGMISDTLDNYIEEDDDNDIAMDDEEKDNFDKFEEDSV